MARTKRNTRQQQAKQQPEQPAAPAAETEQQPPAAEPETKPQLPPEDRPPANPEAYRQLRLGTTHDEADPKQTPRMTGLCHKSSGPLEIIAGNQLGDDKVTEYPILMFRDLEHNEMPEGFTLDEGAGKLVVPPGNWLISFQAAARFVAHNQALERGTTATIALRYTEYGDREQPDLAAAELALGDRKPWARASIQAKLSVAESSDLRLYQVIRATSVHGGRIYLTSCRLTITEIGEGHTVILDGEKPTRE